LVLAAVLPAPAPAKGLEPAQVAVVANSTSEDSVKLARLYAAGRGIPEGHVILVETSTGYAVSRDEFVSQVRDPLRQALEGGKLADAVRCLCLMWGVPVRVEGEGKERGRALGALYSRAAARAAGRLATDHLLLTSVAREFPEPQTEGLEPVGKLFGPQAGEPKTQPGKLHELLARIQALLNAKQREIAALKDAPKRRIAWRQFLAIVQDIHGLGKLIEFLGKVRPPGAPDVGPLKRRLADELAAVGKLQSGRLTPAAASELLRHIQAAHGAVRVAAVASAKAKALKLYGHADASVDSELALLWWGDYDPLGQRANPLHWRAAGRFAGAKTPPALMTARIDGPSPADAKRIIADSLAAEKTGLAGTFYIDAGGKYPPYDAYLKRLVDIVRKGAGGRMKVVLDESPRVFQPGTCPDAAVYVGWYSLAKYVPAFTWKKGAVGWHVASAEATRLRDARTKQWCAKMIQNGAAATAGPVNEPYLQAFPRPDEFFPLLLTGRWTLAECYWRTVPAASWRMTLIGDPLYSPFAKAPVLKADDLPRGLAP
jgi:uncharacterized protein (TIGR03790 family)